MNDLNNYLKIIKDSVKEIEKALIIKGKLVYSIQYFPLTDANRQLLAAVFIERVKDNVSLVEYNLFLVTNPIGDLYIEGVTREAVDISHYKQQFEKFEKNENAWKDLVTQFKLPEDNPTVIVNDFVDKFNRLTNYEYNLKVFQDDMTTEHKRFPSSDQQQWKMDLYDYMNNRGKSRDLVTFITYLNVRLIAILQNVRDIFETYEGFNIELKRKRFNSSMTFPLEASSMMIKSDGNPLVEFNFSWTLDNNQNIHLVVNISRYCVENYGGHEQPSWLVDCEYPSTFEKDLGVIDDLHDLALKWVIINTFEKMTRNYKI